MSGPRASDLAAANGISQQATPEEYKVRNKRPRLAGDKVSRKLPKTRANRPGSSRGLAKAGLAEERDGREVGRSAPEQRQPGAIQKARGRHRSELGSNPAAARQRLLEQARLAEIHARFRQSPPGLCSGQVVTQQGVQLQILNGLIAYQSDGLKQYSGVSEPYSKSVARDILKTLVELRTGLLYGRPLQPPGPVPVAPEYLAQAMALAQETLNLLASDFEPPGSFFDSVA